MFAYFIGGPIDLTKRAVKQEPGTWRVPVKSVAKVATSPQEAGESVAKALMTHEYRLMFREEDVLIYIYQGIR